MVVEALSPEATDFKAPRPPRSKEHQEILDFYTEKEKGEQLFRDIG